MNRLVNWAGLALVACAYCVATLAQDRRETPASEVPANESPVNKELIEAALKLTTEEAGKYSFVLEGGGETTWQREPVLKWSNPSVGEIHGNVFLWTQSDRPAAVGSFYKWFTPHTHLAHEFHSLAETPLVSKSGERQVWATNQAGVRFEPVPGAPKPAASDASRILQMRRLARDFAATKIERDGSRQELRLLTQPIYRYAAPDQQVLDGALFVLVQGTDPEVFLLLEARGPEGREIWQFALARMNGVGFQARYRDEQVWSVEVMPWADIGSHTNTYTTFRFERP